MRRLSATATLCALALAGALCGCSSGSSASGEGRTSSAVQSAPASPSGFDGAPLPGDARAPDFTLTDQGGRSVTLSDYRGRVVVLAFLYSRCGATCVLIAQQIRGALDELEEEGVRAPAVLVVSADPRTDTRASVARFLGEVSLTGRVEYLTGPPGSLQRVWRAYGVTPASASAQAFDRFASILLLDREGRRRVLFQSEVLTPEGLSHDIAKLGSE